jgi:outer membrane receptor protein involved in Fe transport
MNAAARRHFWFVTVCLAFAPISAGGAAEPAPEPRQGSEPNRPGEALPPSAMRTTAPVVVLTRADVEAAGEALIGELLQRLPEQIGGATMQGGDVDGSVRMDLRGLSSERTLVLLNGRRVVFSGIGGDRSVDLNALPTAAIERVEVLKSGASAIHGSDAMAGVINLITRKDFSGVEVSGLGGTSQRVDGTTFDVHGVAGVHGSHGGAFVSMGYASRQQLLGVDRKFSRFDYAYDFQSQTMSPVGSLAIPNGRISSRAAGNAEWDGLRTRYPGASAFTFDPQLGEWRPFRIGLSEEGGDQYNLASDRTIVMPFRRFDVFGSGTLKLGESAEAFVEAMYVNRRSSQSMAPPALFTLFDGFVVSSDNAYNPFGVNFDDVRRRLVEFGDQVFRQEIETYRAVGGLRGSFNLGTEWEWEVALNYGRSQGRAPSTQLHRGRLQNALGPSFVDSTGAIRCGTPEAPIEGCVPLNLFGGAGTITAEMRDAVSIRLSDGGFNGQLAAGGRLGAELFRLPSASAPWVAGLGIEHRRESGAWRPDVARVETLLGRLPPYSGAFDSSDIWLEMWAPLLRRFGNDTGGDLLEAKWAAHATRLAHPAARAPPLEVQAAQTSRVHLSSEVGGRVSPVPDIALRGTWAHAYREPRLGELFLAPLDFFPIAADPCSSAVPGATRPQGTTVDAQCDRERVPDDFFDDRAHVRTIFQGNLFLAPETAGVLTVGMSIQPRWIRNLSLTVDYFDVSVRDAIRAPDPQEIFAACYRSPAGMRSHCETILRGSDSRIDFVNGAYTNAGSERTSGLDFAVQWRPRTPWGTFGVTAGATYLTRFARELLGGEVLELLNTIDLGVAIPEWRANAAARWAFGAVSAAAFLRWIGSFQECETVCSRPDRAGREQLSRRVSPYATVDLSVAYAIRAGERSTTTVRAGVSNLFDRPPPFIAAFPLEGNSDASTYDYLGRFFFIRASHAFR